MTGVSVVTATGTKAKLLNYGDAVEVVFQRTNFVGASSHPLHIHGYSFYLVGTGIGNFNNVTDARSFNLVDPPHINSVAVPNNGWAAIRRFYAINPGVWFIHCQLERHATWGMDTVLMVRNGKTRATCILPRSSNIPTCT
ncbi:hypothetical protein Tsubulata_039501 [Turnera subulata]|uniref:Plastocyanin-like domain-containing protein n=1 Tax=Turnera subulata TaxID=218843 RepID=A0A9Q0GD89_9ROSI|nr:hypothetical protein Tsubulata_039501 [Turnera subulata]